MEESKNHLEEESEENEENEMIKLAQFGKQLLDENMIVK